MYRVYISNSVSLRSTRPFKPTCTKRLIPFKFIYKNWYEFLVCPVYAACRTHRILHYFIILMIFGKSVWSIFRVLHGIRIQSKCVCSHFLWYSGKRRPKTLALETDWAGRQGTQCAAADLCHAYAVLYLLLPPCTRRPALQQICSLSLRASSICCWARRPLHPDWIDWSGRLSSPAFCPVNKRVSFK